MSKDKLEIPVMASIGTFASLSLADVNTMITITVGIITIMYIVVRLAKFLRKWYLEERYPTKVLPLSPTGDTET